MVDLGLIAGSERFSEEGNGNPLQYSCLENPMDRGGWRAIVHGIAKSRMWLSNLTTRSQGLLVRGVRPAPWPTWIMWRSLGFLLPFFSLLPYPTLSVSVLPGRKVENLPFPYGWGRTEERWLSLRLRKPEDRVISAAMAWGAMRAGGSDSLALFQRVAPWCHYGSWHQLFKSGAPLGVPRCHGFLWP